MDRTGGSRRSSRADLPEGGLRDSAGSVEAQPVLADVPRVSAEESWPESATAGTASWAARRPRLVAWWRHWEAVILVGTLAVCVPLLGLAFLASMQTHNRLLFDGPLILRDGAWIAQHGVPHWRLFTPGRHQPWVDQQWLGQLVDFEVWKSLGYTGLALFKVGVLGVTYTGLAALIRGRGASNTLVIGCGMMALLGGLASLVSGAQELVLPLFVLMLAICQRDVARRRPDGSLIALVALCIVWTNMFSLSLGAGFAIAYLLVRAAMMVRDELWPWALGCLTLAFLIRLTPLATPYGAQMIHDNLALFEHHLAGPLVPGAYAPELGQEAFFALVIPLALVVAVALAALMRREKVSVVALGFILLTGIGGGMAVRNIPFFEVTAALFVAHIVQRWVDEHRAASVRRRPLELSVVASDLDPEADLGRATPQPAMAAGV